MVVGRLSLAGFRGDEATLLTLIEAAEPAAIARGEGVVLTFSEHARALSYSGLGRYEVALRPAESATAQDELGVSVWALYELVEAATRSGKPDAAASALDRLAEQTSAAGTEWALGIEARSRALLSEGKQTEELYREAIDHLGRPGSAQSSPARTFSTENGCVARGAASTRATSYAPRTTFSPKSGWRHSRVAPVASSLPRAKRHESA